MLHITVNPVRATAPTSTASKKAMPPTSCASELMMMGEEEHLRRAHQVVAHERGLGTLLPLARLGEIALRPTRCIETAIICAAPTPPPRWNDAALA